MISHGICLTYLTECPQGLSMLLQMARFHSFLWLSIIVVVFQSPSCVQFLETPWTVAHQASCPSPSPGICPSSCSLHQWCHPAVSSSDVLFSFCPQSFLASGTFPMSHLFISDYQNTGASALASVLPGNIQGWSPLRLIGLISLLSKGLSGVFSGTIVQRHQFFGVLPSWPYSSPNHVTIGKTIALTIWMFVYLCVVVVI